MVRRILALARRDRWHRFVEVWRTEGRRVAIRAAFRHAKMGLAGQAPSALYVQASGAWQGNAPGQDCALTPVWTELAQNNAFHVSAAPATKRRRRSVAMIGDLNLPQCRKYRVEQMDEIWGTVEVGYIYAHYEDVPRCLDILQSATHLMLYRLGSSHLAEMYLYEARRLRLPVIYDIDDPLFSFSAYETYSNGDAIDPGLRRRLIDQSPSFLSVMQQADVLTLSTPGLVQAADQLSTRPSYLRRNFADRATLNTGRDAARRAKGHSGFRVAFASGSSGHEVDLLSIMDPLEQFILGAPDRRLHLYGRFDQKRLPKRLRAQTVIEPFRDYGSYLGALAQADCAVLPLVNDAFNQCKSAVRVIDASAVGVPSLVSETGDASAIVLDQETGLKVQPGGWFDALDRLAAQPDQAATLGVAARQDLEKRWAANTEFPVLDPRLIEDVVA